MSQHTPLHTLLFLLLVGLLAILTMWGFPKEGISIANQVTLQYESLDEFFGADPDTSSSTLNFDSLLAATEIDSVALRDSLEKLEQVRIARVTGIQHPDTSFNSLQKFYNALLVLKTKGGKVRVLHYGDSQIEGDRMTRYLRNEWQKTYGGNGPGFVPAFQVIRTSAVQQAHSENWLRYTAYGLKDTTLQHRNYGLLAGFSRYCPPLQSLPAADTITLNPTDTTRADTLAAWLQVKPASYGYSRIKKFSLLKIVLGGNTQPVHISVWADSVEVFATNLAANTFNKTLKIDFAKTPESITIRFKGTDSPNVYALSLESNRGVVVDNIPLRGASGTFFRGINKTLLARQFANEPIKLVILQFGGNSVPYIDTPERAARFGRYFKSNLAYLQSLLPNASFLVVGPSDMATKIKGKFVTYPMLETIRDEVQKAAFAQGAAYYDMYEVMGGKNSMETWVTAEPELAGADYVHFTSRGAQKMAGLLYRALEKDFLQYRGIPADSLTQLPGHEN